jgi:DNA-binding transcriptional ArsR family regulator
MQDLLFDALSDHTRRGVLELLSTSGPMRAGEIADALHVSDPAMSRHLKVLLTAHLIADERVKDDARMRFFRLDTDGVAAAQAYLDQLQMQWRTQLKSFKQHVEKKGKATR